MSIKAINWAWRMELNSTVKIVLLALANWADKDNKCWPGINSLAKRCGLSRRSVINSLNILVKYGLIIRQNRYKDEIGRTSNMYTLDTEIEGLCARDALMGVCARDGGLSAPRAHRVGARGAPYTKVTNNTHLEIHQKEKENKKEKEKMFKKSAVNILIYLNGMTGRNFQDVNSNVSLIASRMKELISCLKIERQEAEEICVRIVRYKCKEWETDKKMFKFLQPATLFNKTKFHQYFGHLPTEEAEHD